MSITLNKERIGNFTSSNMWKLMTVATDKKSFGKPALTYIKEKQWEKKLKRSISTEVQTRPMLWGKFLEQRVHDMLDAGYELISEKSFVHKKIPTWSGSPDNKNVTESVCADTKCYQPKAFCEYVDNLTHAVKINSTEYFKLNHPEEYWQLVSNAVLLDMKNIEAIAYMPYKNELAEIRQAAANFDSLDQYKYRFIAEAPDEELAYLPDDSEYKNLNKFRFEVPKADIDFLTARVLMATAILEA